MLFQPQLCLKAFPKVHLVAASLCLAIVGVTLALLPSEEVSATRTTQEIPLLPAQASLSFIEKEIPTAATAVEDQVAAALALPPPVAAAPAVDTPAIAPALAQTPQALPLPAEEKPAELWREFTIDNGDTLSGVFSKAGLSARDVYEVANTTSAFNRIYPGQKIAFLLNEEGQLHKLRLVQSALKSTLLTRSESGYSTREIERQPEIQHKFTQGTIENSLFLAGERAGLSNRKIMELAAIFGWDVDFALDIRQGDSFSVLYEERYLDGELIGEGNIVAAQFVNQGQAHTALRFTDSQGSSSYYTPEGHSMRKAFIRTPVDFARISSRFNLKRKHPVLNRIRAHKGVDYAARTGTPIQAAGDGKVIFRGQKGGYGNVVILQHGGNITTLYAHMSKFKAGQRIGSRVRQGQIIGYVGATGLASGPHLHYEFRVNGVHKNPMTVSLPQAQPVDKAERHAFKATAKTILTQLETYQATKLAKAEPAQ